VVNSLVYKHRYKNAIKPVINWTVQYKIITSTHCIGLQLGTQPHTSVNVDRIPQPL